MLAAFTGTPAPGSPRAGIRVVVDAHDLMFGRNAEGNRDATLDVLVVVFDDQGKNLHQLVRTVHLNIAEPAFGDALKNGIALNVDAEAPLKAARARVVVHDVFSGSVGSVDLSFK
jgi:hypothetical protein